VAEQNATDCTTGTATAGEGSVLVVGGGVGGVQAALDLADAGYKVYLVEEKDSIGGLMAQLDKTFPTNDCSMCILAPKLVDAGSHPNIQIMASTDILALDGAPGQFEATVLRRARFIDPDKCTGCGICSNICPVELPSLFNEGLGTRKASDRLYPQAVPNSYVITKNGRAPCSSGCPIDTSVQAYVNLIAAGQTKKAAEVIRRENPLPGICGRVCYHPCETSCNRGEIDAPLNIRALKRYAIEKSPDVKPPKIEPSGKRVAIVGAGPAGLSAAHALALEGHSVTVLEALPVLGGMMSVGIPRFRLPQQVLDRDIDFIRALGVEFRTSTMVGRDVSATELERNHDAVLIATGAHSSNHLNIPGEDAPGVIHGIDFLRLHTMGEPTGIGRRVVVVGGGNTAMDAARTARRLGAESVKIVYRRLREQMLAAPHEIDEALEEGIEIVYLTAPVQILTENGRVSGLQCVRMELGDPDETGRRRPIPVEDSAFTVEADTVIPAVSQSPDGMLAQLFGLESSKWGTIITDEVTMATSREKIFSSGDVVLGPASVIEAIAQGKRAATAISNLLAGRPVGEGLAKREKRENPLTPEQLEERRQKTARADRVDPKEVAPDVRVANFDEFEAIYTDEEAKAEASRCMNCADCCECFRCVDVCKAGAIDHMMQDRVEKLDVGAVILALGVETFDPELKGEYGYGIHANVVSSLQFERILCASGPFQGHVQRPSDGAEPLRIAFLQCVGSRDISCGREYCSSVCCTYATKEAILAKEHVPHAAITIFGMDFRTHGKDFEKFMLRAQKESGVRYIRTRVPAVDEDPVTKNLILTYENESGQRVEEEFDLVVLSVGLQVPEKVKALASRLGVATNDFGFAQTREDQPLATTRPGVFVCGAFRRGRRGCRHSPQRPRHPRHKKGVST
jgi:heterodisulfide reductase subunit A-like polyferredoxin